MKETWIKEQRDIYINMCNQFIKNTFTNEKIREEIYNLDGLVLTYLEREDKIFESNAISILIDDTMEMDSISQKEKDEYINELINNGRPELARLAKLVKEKIIEEAEEYISEAEQNNYCPILLKEYK